jgi:flap endonuclease-1
MAAKQEEAEKEEEKEATSGSDSDEDGEKEKKPPKPKAKGRKGGITMPEHWPWEEAKQLFVKPDVIPADEVEVFDYFIFHRIYITDASKLEWKDPDVDGLVQFLVKDNGFKYECLLVCLDCLLTKCDVLSAKNGSGRAPTNCADY